MKTDKRIAFNTEQMLKMLRCGARFVVDAMLEADDDRAISAKEALRLYEEEQLGEKH